MFKVGFSYTECNWVVLTYPVWQFIQKGVFRTFTFNVIINIIRFKSTILLFVLY